MDTRYLSDLQQRFGIPDTVTFTRGPGGIPVVDIANPLGQGRIAIQGAQLLSFTPAGQAPVVWLSPEAQFMTGKSARGGVPICWPWFGPAKQPGFPTHGFARTAPWEVIEVSALENGAHRLGFRLVRTDADDEQWPYSTPLEVYYTLGSALEIELVTRNHSPQPITLGEALHTYFTVGDVREILIHGLDRGDYIDKVDGGQRKQQTGPIAIAGEVDRVYLDTAADCLIDDPVLNRRIRIAKRGGQSTVVWNPWQDKAAKLGDMGEAGYLGMVCVESGNAADDILSLAPGAEHRLWVRYSAEALA